MTVKESAEYDNFLGKKEETAKEQTLAEFLGMEETDENEREKHLVCEQSQRSYRPSLYL